MPKAAAPKPAPQAPPRPVQSAGNQDDFREEAVKLAADLGWAGDPDWVTNDIRVDDAQNYITKMLHEHFQAGALGQDQPSYLAACEHLAVDNADEQSSIDAALAKAFESGKGATVTSTPATVAGMNANIEAKLGLEG
jgi:hypothetical protein